MFKGHWKKYDPMSKWDLYGALYDDLSKLQGHWVWKVYQYTIY